MKKRITEEALRALFEKYGYNATDKILYRMWLGLNRIKSKRKDPAQAIYGLCLDGPPGSGKSELAKVYTKILKDIYGEDNVVFIGYQCDPTTGKTELYEDLNIIATVVDKDRNHIIIPGAISKAVQKAQEGKIVILFLDEYDKAREETDSFLLQFFQDAKINTTQGGDLEISQKDRNNIQVFMCKNDVRKDLSNQLYRRLHMLRLDYMSPEMVYEVALRKLIKDISIDKTSETKNIEDAIKNGIYDDSDDVEAVSENVLNLVVSLYSDLYNDRIKYIKLPSVSEILIAIEEVNELINYTNAPKREIYNVLIEDLFKYEDDIKTFESQLKKYKIKDVIEELRKGDVKEISETDLTALMAQSVFKDYTKVLDDKIQAAEGLIRNYTVKFGELERMRKSAIDKELGNSDDSLKRQPKPKTVGNFFDQSKYIRRGQNVFDLHDSWYEVASITVPGLQHENFINTIQENISSLGVTIYENGIVLIDGYIKLILIATKDEKNKLTYKLMSNNGIIPSGYLQTVYDIIEILKRCLEVQNTKVTHDDVVKDYTFAYDVNAVIYNESELEENIYQRIVNDHIYEFTLSDGTICKSVNMDKLKNIVTSYVDEVCPIITDNLEEGKVYEKIGN